MSTIIYYIAGAIISLLVIWAVGSHLTVATLEEPSYTVVSQHDGYEIRNYEPHIVAEATVTAAEYRSGLNNGFRLVADYIFGNNTSQEKISMTTPVLETPQSEKITMTVPVLETTTDTATRTIAFVLPSKYTMETLPQPNNDRVILRQVPAKIYAVSRFTWYPTPERVERKKQELLDMLSSDNITILGEPQAAFYNPPLSMPLVLRNEILVPIE